MPKQLKQRSPKYTLAWVYPDWLTERLDSATWIETSRELDGLGWDVRLLSMDDKAGSRWIRGVETITFPARNVYLMGQLLFHLDISRYLIKNWEELDIIYFTQLSGFWLFPLRWYRYLRGSDNPKLIMDTRDLDDPVPGSWKSKARIQFHRLVFKLADTMADGQTAITLRLAELVQIPSNELLGIWPSGVRVEDFAPSAEKRIWPKAGQPIHLMYIGILLERRNPAALCKAVLRANAEGMSFRLSFVGDGPAREAIEAFAASAPAEISLQKPVAHDQVPDLLAEAHIGVTSLPEPDDVKYQASSPVKLFEYMAAGLPVLATTSACHTEVVGDGRYTYWAKDASEEAIYEALCALWMDRDNLALRGQEAQVAANDWTWTAASKKLSDSLYRGLELAPGSVKSARSNA